MRIAIVNPETVNPGGNNEILLRVTPEEGSSLRVIRDPDSLDKSVKEVQLVSTYGLSGKDTSKPWILVLLDERNNDAQIQEVPLNDQEQPKKITIKEVFERVKQVIADTLDYSLEQIEGDQHLTKTWGTDSLDLTNLSIAFEEEFKVHLDEDEIRSLQVQQIANKIWQLLIDTSYDKENKQTLTSSDMESKLKKIIAIAFNVTEDEVSMDHNLLTDYEDVTYTDIGNVLGLISKEFGVLIEESGIKELTLNQIFSKILIKTNQKYEL